LRASHGTCGIDELNSQQLPPLSLSNTNFLQEVLHEKNDRKLSGYVNAGAKFIDNISQITNKRRRQGPHNVPPAPRKKKQLRRAPQVEASALNDELASALNATNTQVHLLQGQVNELLV
jgi:hypothetical protein